MVMDKYEEIRLLPFCQIQSTEVALSDLIHLLNNLCQEDSMFYNIS